MTPQLASEAKRNPKDSALAHAAQTVMLGRRVFEDDPSSDLYVAPPRERFAALKHEVRALAKQKDAVILVHNYQRPEIQDVGTFLGDSLKLAREAATTTAKRIVFCGVDFMAETSKIINPEKEVFHPNTDACCPMAAMIDVDGLALMKEKHPGVPVVSYVNTSAAVKALSDVACTSANAVEVVEGLGSREIIFTPDTNLGLYVQSQLPWLKVHFWPGYCPTHMLITAEEIKRLMERHPDAEVLVHPECTPDVVALGDKVASTEGIIRHVAASTSEEFIVATERDVCYRALTFRPGAKLYPVKVAVCPTMKKVTLENVRQCLLTGRGRIDLTPELIERARVPVERMVAVSGRRTAG